jgi:hypothetical protein
MKKIGILLLTILIATLLAGIYGALHDQITFTISSEYFTIFKFEQFGFLDWGNNNPRLTTALIGFLATWWVGFYIGIVQGLVGLIHKTSGLMFKYVFNSILITLGIAVLFGIFGGIIEILTGEADPICFPYEIHNCKNFFIVGSIHNYGYLGGGIGAIVGLVYQIYQKYRANQ